MTCKHLLQGTPDCVFCHRDQLKQKLSLAEEGLANYEEEMQARIKLMQQKDAEIAELRRCLDGGVDCAGEKLRLRKALEDIKQECLTWSIACECGCHACETLSSVIRLSVPQTSPQPAKE